VPTTNELTIIALAGLALATTPNLSSYTDTLSDLKFGDGFSDFDDFADNFMTSHHELGLPWTPAPTDSVMIYGSQQGGGAIHAQTREDR
jgi:hypothetical protein